MNMVRVAMVMMMVVVSGCGVNDPPVVLRVGGDYETAHGGVGVRPNDQVEVGVMGMWFKTQPDETYGAKAYGIIKVDPNTLEPLGLGGSWNIPGGAEVRVGGALGVDFEEKGVMFGPVVVVDLLPDTALCPSLWYEYAMYGNDLARHEGFEDTHKVFFGAVYQIPKKE